MSFFRSKMLLLLLLFSLVWAVVPAQADSEDDLIITGVIDGPLSGGLPKAVELYVINDIPDLSIYGLGSANNGGGTGGQEFTFPAANATAGQFIYVATEVPGFTSFFGFAPDYTSSATDINGDDAIELFTNGAVSDVFGQINVDGTGQPWEYLDGWTYRVDATGPDGATFVLGNWSFSGPNALDGESANNTAVTPFPIGSYSVTGSDNPPAVNSTNPVNGSAGVAVDASVTVTFSEAVTFGANTVDYLCDGASGSFTVAPSGGPTTWDVSPPADFAAGESCVVTVEADDVTDLDGTPDNMSGDYSWSFVTAGGACGVGGTPIHTIQGNGLSSPVDGNVFTIAGVVVGDFQTGLNGFFVQEESADQDADPTTSEGIFVYAPAAIDVNVGDLVEVTGTVDEYFALTELTSVSSVTVCSSGNPLPPAVTLSLPFPPDVGGVPYLERLEGMRVIVPAGLTVTDVYSLGRGGEFTLSAGGRLFQPTQVALPGAAAQAVQADNDLNRILIDDGLASQNPATVIHPAPALSLADRVRTGDTLAADLSGVLTYSWSGWSGSLNVYRVQPTAGGASFNALNPRPVAVPSVGNADVTVASANVLNYFNGNGSGGDFPTSRGADTYAEFLRQHDKLVAKLTAMNADIIGLMEIENDGYGVNSAIQELVDGLNAVAGAGTYAFINPGVGAIGTDEIAVGLLYKPAVVTPVGPAAILDSTVDATFLDTKNRPVLAQTFAENGSGERFTVVVNHLKSKGSDCLDVGDPDLGDGQGNCNVTRTTAAIAQANWLATDPTGSGDTDFLVIGDLNAYSLEDPILAFYDRGFLDLTRGFGSNYSYTFQGQFGHLDHALATASLTAQVSGVAVWHNNSDEPPAFDYNDYNQPALYAADAFRASDHDPILIGLDFQQQADFSDLESSYGVAWHTGNGEVRLGSGWNGDSAYGFNGDNATDDGVTIGAGSGPANQWQDGVNGGSLNVTVTGSGNGCLYGWIDWNQDGAFGTTGEEYIIRGETTGSGNYVFTVPSGTFQTPPGSTTPTQTYNLRVRLYEACASGPTGAAIGGEVEDYQLRFSPTAVTLTRVSGEAAVPFWLILGLAALIVVLGFAALGLTAAGKRRTQN